MIVAAVESVRRQTYDDWELLIVAQGADPSDFRAIAETARVDPRVHLIHLEMMNRSNALNVAMKSATGDIFAFTDDDCEVASDWIVQIVAAFEENAEVGLVGGELTAAPKKRRFTISSCPTVHAVDVIYSPSRDGYHSPDGMYMLGANTAVRREVAERLGGFDVTLGPGTPFPACEDLDFGIRAESIDTMMLTAKRILVHHAGGRRYGLRAFLKHHRNYARGRGGILSKLQMWGHRLGDEWGRRSTARELLVSAIRNPPRFLVEEVYHGYHGRRAAREFATGYELGPDLLCRPRGHVPALDPTTRVSSS
jgi:glycosyltransferase involved in cell wall biosynthesis